MGHASVAHHFSDIGNTVICFFKKTLRFLNPIDVDIFAGGVAGDFFKDPADVIFTKEESGGQIFQGNVFITVL